MCYNINRIIWRRKMSLEQDIPCESNKKVNWKVNLPVLWLSVFSLLRQLHHVYSLPASISIKRNARRRWRHQPLEWPGLLHYLFGLHHYGSYLGRTGGPCGAAPYAQAKKNHLEKQQIMLKIPHIPIKFFNV